MIKVGVLKNESIIFNSVERHLMKNDFFVVENSINCFGWKKISASDGQWARENEILVERNYSSKKITRN